MKCMGVGCVDSISLRMCVISKRRLPEAEVAGAGIFTIIAGSFEGQLRH